MRRGALVCCFHDMRRLLTTPRAWAVGLLLALLLDSQMQPIRFMLLHESQKVSWFGMVTYLLNDSQVTMFCGLLFMMLLFDVPMTDETQKYIIVRTGRAAWARGHVLYIIAATFVYLLLFFLMVGAMLWPYLDWSGGWGTGIVAFTEGMFEVYDSMLNYDPWLIRVYTPFAGAMLSLGLKCLGLITMALTMCSVNVYFQTRLGFLASAIFLMIDSVADEYFSIPMYYFSPISLTRLSFLDYGDEMGRPPLLYGVIVLALLCIGLSMLTIHLCRRREIRL